MTIMRDLHQNNTQSAPIISFCGYLSMQKFAPIHPSGFRATAVEPIAMASSFVTIVTPENN